MHCLLFITVKLLRNSLYCIYKLYCMYCMLYINKSDLTRSPLTLPHIAEVHIFLSVCA